MTRVGPITLGDSGESSSLNLPLLCRKIVLLDSQRAMHRASAFWLDTPPSYTLLHSYHLRHM
jgi:hypothetical protein